MSIISVIVPAYNVEPYLERCINSILSQSFTDFELILVDDGSPDNCGVICEDFAAQDSRIQVIHQKNGGLSAARNTGIDWVLANSNSEWITFVDSDDWVHPQYLYIMFNAVKQFGANIAICNHVAVQNDCENEKIDNPIIFCKESEEAYIDPEIAVMPAWAKLYKKSIWKPYRFPVGKLHEDAYITHRIILEQEQISVIHEKLYFYYYSNDSIMRRDWAPRRLDEIEAWQLRLQYLKDHHFSRAYQHDSNIFLWIICIQLDAMPRNREFEQYRVYLKKQLLKSVKKCENLSLEQKLYFYSIVFPIILRLPYRCYVHSRQNRKNNKEKLP